MAVNTEAEAQRAAASKLEAELRELVGKRGKTLEIVADEEVF